MSRCWGCCQENCGYYHCTCGCHDPDDPRVNPPKETPKCSCKEHKRYQAKRPPRSTCEACWRFYVKVHP